MSVEPIQLIRSLGVKVAGAEPGHAGRARPRHRPARPGAADDGEPGRRQSFIPGMLPDRHAPLVDAAMQRTGRAICGGGWRSSSATTAHRCGRRRNLVAGSAVFTGARDGGLPRRHRYRRAGAARAKPAGAGMSRAARDLAVAFDLDGTWSTARRHPARAHLPRLRRSGWLPLDSGSRAGLDRRRPRRLDRPRSKPRAAAATTTRGLRCWFDAVTAGCALGRQRATPHRRTARGAEPAPAAGGRHQQADAAGARGARCRRVALPGCARRRRTGAAQASPAIRWPPARAWR